jgi:hypothetical protein
MGTKRCPESALAFSGGTRVKSEGAEGKRRAWSEEPPSRVIQIAGEGARKVANSNARSRSAAGAAIARSCAQKENTSRMY